jgi:hypothetical protein
MKKIVNWSVVVGPYPGLILGVRDYNYEKAVYQEDNIEYSTKDRVFYVPFFMLIVTFLYAKPVKPE